MAETRAVDRSWQHPEEHSVELRFDDFRTFLKSYAANISLDGMFVESDRPMPAETTVALALSLSDGHPLISGRGAVVWTRATGNGTGTPN